MISKKPRKQRKTLSCSFCRLRKKKCDRKRPQCTYCVKNSNKICLYSTEDAGIDSFGSNIARSSALNTRGYTFVDFSESPSLNECPTADENRSSKASVILSFAESFLTGNSEVMLSSVTTNKIGITDSETSLSLFFQEEMTRIENKIIDLEFVSYMKKSDKGNIVIQDNDIIDFRSATYAARYYRVNSVNCFKPFNMHMITTFDKYISEVRAITNSSYRKFKGRLKNARINSSSKVFLANMPESLHEGFKVNTMCYIFGNMMNSNHPNYEFNSALFLSTCQAKKKSKAISLHTIKPSEEERQNLLIEIQENLPRLDIVLFLWDVYKQYVYPFIPVLDLNSFEQDLEVLIVGLRFNASRDDKNRPNFKIILTTYVDFANLGIFLIALRTSYLCLKVNSRIVGVPENSIENEILNINCLEYIGVDYCVLATECLLESRYTYKTGFNVILLLLHMLYYSQTCEEGEDTVYTGNCEVFTGMIYDHAIQMGLFYDDIFAPNFASSKSSVSYPGICPTTIAQFQRNLWLILKRFIVIESSFNGFPISCINSKKGFSTEDLKLDFVDENMRYMILKGHDIFREFCEIYEDLNFFVYQKSGDLKQKKLYTYILKLDVAIIEKFTLNPVEFFLNNENFSCEISNDILGNMKMYQLMFDKITKFENYLITLNLKFKMTCLFFFESEKRCLENNNFDINALYFLKYCLNDIVIGIELIHCYYIMRNYDFLNLSINKNFKNFNHHLTKPISEAYYNFHVILAGILYRLFNSIHVLNKRKFNHEKVDEALRSKLIDLKNELLSCYSLILICLSEFPGLYYLTTLKGLYFFNEILQEFKASSYKVDKGESFKLVGFSFNVRDDACDDEAHGKKPGNDEIFLHLNSSIFNTLYEPFLKLGSTLMKHDHQNRTKIVNIFGDYIDITQFQHPNTKWIDQQVNILNHKEKNMSEGLISNIFENCPSSLNQ